MSINLANKGMKRTLAALLLLTLAAPAWGQEFEKDTGETLLGGYFPRPGDYAEMETGKVIASALPRCLPEILCNPPKLDPQYLDAFTGLSGEDFQEFPVEDKWGYIAGVWDSFLYRYYYEKDEEFK